MVTSGASVLTTGRMPRAEKSWSEMASLERRATNWVLRRLSFVPCESMTKVAPGARWLDQSTDWMPS